MQRAELHAAPQRRGLLIAAVVGGVALLGGVGALALSFGKGEGADVPVVVKADNGPVKVKPENPGGTSLPNQDNKVYDAVKGTDGTAATPTQEKLVTTSEEPVDMAAVEAKPPTPACSRPAGDRRTTDDRAPKAEDRVDPAANADDEATVEAIAVMPRKVKTMVVRADGTLAPREDPAPARRLRLDRPLRPKRRPTARGSIRCSRRRPAADDQDRRRSTPDQPAEPTFQSPGADPVPVKTVKTDTIAVTDWAEPTQTASVPETVARRSRRRPADQPVDVVGEVKPEPVAPERVAAANVDRGDRRGSWSVQIASQPSAESAKSTYQDLAAPLWQRASPAAASTSSRPISPARERSGVSACRRSRATTRSSLCTELQVRRRQLLRLEVVSRQLDRKPARLTAAPVSLCWRRALGVQPHAVRCNSLSSARRSKLTRHDRIKIHDPGLRREIAHSPTKSVSIATNGRGASSCLRAISASPSRSPTWSPECATVSAVRHAPVFIDQEGGRVQRLRPPLAPNYPAGGALGAL